MNFEEFKTQYQKISVEEFPNRAPETPMVSVCVQTYQHAPYIKECLDGILKQETEFLFEILLGEDASTDGTREICLEYAEAHPDKIRLFLHYRENNIEILGRSTGRFNALYNIYSARGAYLAICEGDDYWTDPTKLQKQYFFMKDNPEYSICGHDAFIIKAGEIIKESKLPEGQKRDFSSSEVQKGIFILTMSVFFKNISKYPSESIYMINFDTFLFVYLGQFGHYKFMSNIKPACYRLHDGGMWSANRPDLREISDLNTQFWIAKYFERIHESKLSDHYGINLTRKSLIYLVEPTWGNYGILIKHMFIIKFPKLANRIIRAKKYFIKK